jgi:uncharacterized protein (TIGR02466 family)
METMLLFPCPLFKFDYNRANETKEKIVNRIKEIEKVDTNNISSRYTAGSYTSFYSIEDIFTESVFDDLKIFIKDSVDQVHYASGLSGELKFNRSWVNINRKYSYHEEHHHCPNVWSGVYYVQAGIDDATISFMNSNILNSSWPYRAKKIYNNDINSSQTVCKAFTGMLLIFPSYLRHKVDQQMNEEERISIAFNMDLA